MEPLQTMIAYHIMIFFFFDSEAEKAFENG